MELEVVGDAKWPVTYICITYVSMLFPPYLELSCQEDDL